LYCFSVSSDIPINEPFEYRWKNTILDNIPINTDAYFVHSFVAVPTNENDILATTNYGEASFCSAVQHENICGTQFHPEKSSTDGLAMLRNFVNLIK
jgi:glutamine amidotransferase